MDLLIKNQKSVNQKSKMQNLSIKNKTSKIKNVRGFLLDFGGTIDTNGLHWAEVLWLAYTDAGVPVERQIFREAYKHGERTLALQPIIKPEYNFYDVLIAKTDIQLRYLAEAGHLPASFDIPEVSEQISIFCYDLVKNTVCKAVSVLDILSKSYPIVLVSNFYGNIRTVLEDLELDKYFRNIVESAVVGVRKPDPEIFMLGVRALGFEADRIAVVGDSYSKDIIPAKQAGCQTVWLKGKEWEETADTGKADIIIYSFSELKELFE